MKVFIAIITLLLAVVLVSNAFAERIISGTERNCAKAMLLNINEHRLEESDEMEDDDFMVRFRFLYAKNPTINVNLKIEKAIRMNFFNENEDVYRFSFKKGLMVKEIFFTLKRNLHLKKNSCGLVDKFNGNCFFHEPQVPEKIVILTIFFPNSKALQERIIDEKNSIEIISALRVDFRAEHKIIQKNQCINLYTNQYYAKHSIEVSKKDVRIKKTKEKFIKDFLIGSF